MDDKAARSFENRLILRGRTIFLSFHLLPRFEPGQLPLS